MTCDTQLLARAGEQLAVALELQLGYPDAPERLLQQDPEATSVVIEIYARLISERQSVPGPIEFLVHHLSSRRR